MSKWDMFRETSGFPVGWEWALLMYLAVTLMLALIVLGVLYG